MKNKGLFAKIASLSLLGLGLVSQASATAPAHVWSKAFGSATNDEGYGVATDANGNIYLTGFFTGSASFGGPNLTCPTYSNGCLFLAKFAPDGTPQWSKSFNNDYGTGNAVATDAFGNVFLVGGFADADFGCGTGILSGSIFVVKLAPDGSCLWSKPYKSVATAGTGNAGGQDAINGLAIDTGGNVLLVGKFGCSTNEGCAINFGGGLIVSPQQPSYGGVFLAKLSGTSGSWLWSNAYGGVSGQDIATGVAVDSSNNAFITGYFSSSILNLGGSNLANAGSSDIFLAKYSGSTGAPLWSKSFGGASGDNGMAIAVDSGGAAVITGQFVGTANFGGVSLTSASPFYSDMFLARYASADGSYLWAKNFGSTVPASGRAIAKDANGHIEITGFFMGTVDFGNGLPLTSNGGLDIFLAQYNAADGSTVWAKGFGALNGDAGLGVAIDNGGNTLMTGYFQGAVDFGGGSINGGGALDVFLAKYGSAVSKTNTTATLTSGLNPSTFAQTVTFTDTVSPSSATGTVTFFDGANSLGTSTLSGGIATLPTASLSIGPHSITATYSGDSSYNGNTSPALTQTVNTATKTNTTTSLISSLNPSILGQSVTFTASISSSAATGTVTFFDGATSLGSGAVSGGSAALSTSSLTAGSHSITASYNGDSSYNGSTSPALAQTVNKAGTTTGLTSSLNPSTSGLSVTFTAAVSPSAASGTVTFFDGATSLGSGAVSGGSATLSTSSLTAGSHSITASYNGDSSYNVSTSPTLTQTVNTGSKTNTTLSLASNLNPSTSGQMVTITATISPSGATGTVSFFDGGTPMGSGTLSGGIATISTSSLSVGSHSIQANYGGDSNYNGTISPVLTQTVSTATKTNTTTGLGSSLNPSTVGQPVTFTATVSPSTASGTVTFLDGGSAIGSGTLSGGQTTFTTSSLSTGSHSITASYGGDSSDNGSTSGALTQTVNMINTTASLGSNPNPSNTSQMVSLTATISPSTATGTVRFLDGGTQIGSASLSGGKATFSTSSLSAGSHSMTATYGGDSSDNGSTSGVMMQTVNVSKATSTTSLGSSPNPSSWGQLVTFTATVSPSTATGSVSFLDGGVQIAFAALSGGSATFSTSGLSVGTHSITASYGGDTNDNGSASGAVSQAVNKAATSTSLVSNINPSTSGQVVTFTAGVSPSTATGTVTFFDGGSAIGSGNLSGGQAAFSTSGLAVGTHSITASYGGDGNYSASASSLVSQAVNSSSGDNTPPTVSITSPAPSRRGSATVSGTVAITGTASDNSGSVTVTVAVNGTVLCTISNISSWSCSWNTTTFPNSGYTLTATAVDPSNNSSVASLAVKVSNSTGSHKH